MHSRVRIPPPAHPSFMMIIEGVPKEHLTGLSNKPSVTIRVNTLRITKELLRKKLEKKGFELSDHPVYEEALRVLKQPFSIGAATEYLLGYYIVQDAASMLAVSELMPRPHDIVLDMCAGPGPKTTHLSELMNNKGAVIACESNKKRLLSVKYNAQRMGCTNVMGLNIDARKVGELGLMFDRILLDPPCSALGTLYKNPELVNKEIHYNRIKKLQIELLEAGIKVLKPRGTLVYSTCTVTLKENEEIVKHAINQGLKLQKLSAEAGLHGLSGLDDARRFYPRLTDTQGFFIAKMVKA